MRFNIGDKVRMKNLFNRGVDTDAIHTVTEVKSEYQMVSSNMYTPMRHVQQVKTDLDPDGRCSDWFFKAD